MRYDAVRHQRNFAAFIISVLMAFLIFPLLNHSADTTRSDIAFVFKPDGSMHCEPYEGVPLDVMELELYRAGIEVLSAMKKHDGREGIALCGKPTGQINIYKIRSSDLASAFAIGFRPLPEGWTSK